MINVGSGGVISFAGDSGGQIYTSNDSGVSWTARESVRNWVSIAMSADGTKLAAAVNNGYIYTSVNTASSITGGADDMVELQCIAINPIVKFKVINSSSGVRAQ
jgi:hypothetical protein